MAKSVDDIFAGIKRGSTERLKPRSAPNLAAPSGRIVADNNDTVTIALTMKRKLFDRYNTGKNRGRFQKSMIQQLERKWD